MKQQYLLIILLACICHTTSAQTTSIPDANFEAFLEANGMGNGIAGDNLVTTANIENVTILDLSSYTDIEDLTGIEYFTALITLNCSSSNITTINLSTLTHLESLNCSNTDLVTLDLTSNTSLIELYVSTTDLTELDLSQNTALTVLIADTNPNLASLNVRNGNNMNVTSIITVDSPNLACIVVDDPAYSDANWSLPNSTIFSDVDCALTAIPNNRFLEKLQIIPELANSFTGTMVLTHKIAALTTLSLSGSSINDVTGIEDFTGLQELTCINTSITSIDLTQNTALTQLNLANNALTNLDISQNVLLTALYCNNNMLTDIDVHLNTQLEQFDCSSNQLTRLNIKNGNNGALTTSNLDINPNLTCIKVDDPTASYLTPPIWVKDAQSSYDLSCGETYVPDDNFEQALIDLGYDTGALDDSVPTANINTITSLFVGGKGIADFTGIQDFVGLITFDPNNNPNTTLNVSNLTNLVTFTPHSNLNLTSVNVTGLTNLKFLRINNTSITTLDISTNTALERLWAFNLPSIAGIIDTSNNPLIWQLVIVNSEFTGALDVSHLTNLTYLDCRDNDLSALNASNGNNGNVTLFNATNNPNLNCIKVDDETALYLSTSIWEKDATATYSDTSCSINISPKVFLQGAALNPNTGEETLMRDDLRTALLLPTTSPYSDNATCDVLVFNTTGIDAIVDWIWIELRDATDNTIIIDSQSALLQRDGDVVSIDGVSDVNFNRIPGNYYVAIKHRNHLGIMSSTALALSNTVLAIDFTDSNNPVTYGSEARTSFGMPFGRLGMWTGNANGDTIVQYSGTDPDVTKILSTVLNDAGNFLNFPTYSVVAYKTDDVNMDGNTQYTGTTPELTFILQNVLAHPGNFLNFSTYQIIEQLPENITD